MPGLPRAEEPAAARRSSSASLASTGGDARATIDGAPIDRRASGCCFDLLLTQRGPAWSLKDQIAESWAESAASRLRQRFDRGLHPQTAPAPEGSGAIRTVRGHLARRSELAPAGRALLNGHVAEPRCCTTAPGVTPGGSPLHRHPPLYCWCRSWAAWPAPSSPTTSPLAPTRLSTRRCPPPSRRTGAPGQADRQRPVHRLPLRAAQDIIEADPTTTASTTW